MGSLSSQFSTVAEIWRVKVGSYAHFFGKMYGKSKKKVKNFQLKIEKTQHQITFRGQNWAQTLVSWPSTIARFKFLIFWFLAEIWPFLGPENWIFAFFDHKKGHILAKNQKIKNLNLAIVEGHETKVWANFWPQKVIWCWVFSIFRENFLIFYPEFPYIFLKKCA